MTDCKIKPFMTFLNTAAANNLGIWAQLDVNLLEEIATSNWFRSKTEDNRSSKIVKGHLEESKQLPNCWIRLKWLFNYRRHGRKPPHQAQMKNGGLPRTYWWTYKAKIMIIVLNTWSNHPWTWFRQIDSFNINWTLKISDIIQTQKPY